MPFWQKSNSRDHMCRLFWRTSSRNLQRPIGFQCLLFAPIFIYHTAAVLGTWERFVHGTTTSTCSGVRLSWMKIPSPNSSTGKRDTVRTRLQVLRPPKDIYVEWHTHLLRKPVYLIQSYEYLWYCIPRYCTPRYCSLTAGEDEALNWWCLYMTIVEL